MLRNRSRRAGGRYSFFVRTALSAALIGGFSIVGAHYLADQSEVDRRALARLAGLISEESADTLTTGSVAGAASRAKLDPCVVERKR